MKFLEESKGLLCVLAILLFCSLSLTRSPVSSFTLSTGIFNWQTFFGRAVCGKFADANRQEIRLQKFKRQIQALKMSVAKLGGTIVMLIKHVWFLGRGIHPQIWWSLRYLDSSRWNWKVRLRNGKRTEYVASKLWYLTWFSLSWHLENAEVARAFPAAQGWNIVAWWFGKGNPLQALHDVGGLLEGPRELELVWESVVEKEHQLLWIPWIRKVESHNPTIFLPGCQGRTCSRYQWWCHVRYHRGGTIQFEGQWSGENPRWLDGVEWERVWRSTTLCN